MSFIEPSLSVNDLLARIGRMVGVNGESAVLANERLRDSLQSAVELVCGYRDWSWKWGTGRFSTVVGASKYNLRQAGHLTFTNTDFVLASGLTKTYRIDQDFDPETVTEAGTALTEVAWSSTALATVEGTAARWTWDPASYSLYIHATADADITASTSAYAVTGTALQDLEVVTAMRDHETGDPIGFIPLDFFQKEYAGLNQTSNSPDFYYPISYGVYGLYPTPSAVRVIDVDYKRQHRNIAIGGTLSVPSYLHTTLAWMGARIYLGEANLDTRVILDDPLIQAGLTEAAAIDNPAGSDYQSSERRSNRNAEILMSIDTTNATAI